MEESLTPSWAGFQTRLAGLLAAVELWPGSRLRLRIPGAVDVEVGPDSDAANVVARLRRAAPAPDLVSVDANGPVALYVALLGLGASESVDAADPEALARTVTSALHSRGQAYDVDSDGDLIATVDGRTLVLRLGLEFGLMMIEAELPGIDPTSLPATALAAELNLLNRTQAWSCWTRDERSLWQTITVPLRLGDHACVHAALDVMRSDARAATEWVSRLTR